MSIFEIFTALYWHYLIQIEYESEAELNLR